MASRIRLALAALLIAMVSVVSASIMVPDRDDAARVATALTFGSIGTDECGDEGHDHRCPFCRVTPETAFPQPGDLAFDVRPPDGWRQLHDLRPVDVAAGPGQSARAPPFPT